MADPPLLRTCHASREVALRTYRKAFLSNLFVSDSVYFENDIDTMYLTSEAQNLWIMSTTLLHARTHPMINNAGLPGLRKPHLGILSKLSSTQPTALSLNEYPLNSHRCRLVPAICNPIWRGSSLLGDSGIVNSGVMGRLLSVLSDVENLEELFIILNKDFQRGSRSLEAIKITETDSAPDTGLEIFALGSTEYY